MTRARTRSIVLAIVLVTSSAFAQSPDAKSLVQFEREATLAKELGATHVSIGDDLPPSLWQFDSPGDPYPAWYVYRLSLLKLFPPKDVQPYVNMAYAQRITTMIEERCKVLRKLGLKGHWNSNEPQVLPEAFFTAYPSLRGPRVDQPNRSRVPRFSPCVDQPETLRLYREAMKELVRRFPEIDSFGFLTQDSGAGFCWVPSLYPGLNGHSDCKDHPMERRIAGFLINLQQAAKEAGNDITININPITPRQWMLDSFPSEQLDSIVKALPRGLAVQGREGPDGRAFNVPSGGTSSGRARNEFSPVVGIVVPSMTGGGGGRGGRGGAAAGDERRRVMIDLGDPTTFDFSYRLNKVTRGLPTRNAIERLQNLRAFAVTEVGEDNADALLEVWTTLDRATENLNALNFGSMLRFGHVLNRWVARPMVPFPDELSMAEKQDWRPFIFQAREEEQAMNLVDIQGMRMFEGWGAKMLFQRVIETTAPQVQSASTRIARIAPSVKDESNRRYWELYAKRLEAVHCLLLSADHMVSYQAHLDRVRDLKLQSEKNPPLGVQSDWARTDMMELARKEIDTMVRLRKLITETKEPIFDLADSAEEETIMKLGPNLADQLKRKIDTMNGHWRDYDRIFSVPNP